MKRILAIVIIVLGVAGVLWVAKAWTPRRVDPKVLKFNTDADNLILGLQQYREFVGSYPTGNNVTIAKALLGRTEKECRVRLDVDGRLAHQVAPRPHHADRPQRLLIAWRCSRGTARQRACQDRQ